MGLRVFISGVLRWAFIATFVAGKTDKKCYLHWGKKIIKMKENSNKTVLIQF